MPKEKHPGGRPRIEIDFDIVSKLASIQCTQEEIASVLGVSLSTLDHNQEFLRIFRDKRQSGKASLRRKQWQMAVEQGNPTMLVWLGKNYLGQQDKMEHSGNISVITVDIPGLTDKEEIEVIVNDKR